MQNGNPCVGCLCPQSFRGSVPSPRNLSWSESRLRRERGTGTSFDHEFQIRSRLLLIVRKNMNVNAYKVMFMEQIAMRSLFPRLSMKRVY